jgi:catechol 2,3-dioxygenase-like lactoylglutathione lyase family enzyme
MSIEIKAVNHVCLVVQDQLKAEGFYIDVLGLRRHKVRDSWLHLTDATTLHLVEIPEASVDQSLYHEVQHFALQTGDLRNALGVLINAGLHPFQMDFEGNEKQVATSEDPLTFGIGTLFVNDPDGNLVEFIELGRGVFESETV